MNAPWAAKPHPCRPGLSFWWLLGGVCIGLLFLLGMQLKLQWFALIFLVFMVLIASLPVEDKKNYFLILFVLALPIWIGKNLYLQPSPYRIFTFGFPIHISLLPLTALYVIWALRQVVGEEPTAVSTRGLLSLAGVFGAAAISSLGSTDKIFAAFDLFALGTSILIFIYAASEIRQRRELRLVLGLLIFSAALQGAIALVQHFTGATLGLDYFGEEKKLYGYVGLEVISRVGGLIGHPNSLALFFDLMLPLSLSLLFSPMRGRTRFYPGRGRTPATGRAERDVFTGGDRRCGPGGPVAGCLPPDPARRTNTRLLHDHGWGFVIGGDPDGSSQPH